MAINVNVFWAEGYNGKIQHECYEDPHSMYFHHCCRHVSCKGILDSKLVNEKELDYCYKCGEPLR